MAGKNRQDQAATRTARLVSLSADIEAHLDQPDLSSRTVAERAGITADYVRKIFRAEGTSFTRFVMERRLDRAKALLLAEDQRHMPISHIALSVGFNDISYFNRCFRRRFGMAPSELRRGNNTL